jgi:integrase
MEKPEEEKNDLVAKKTEIIKKNAEIKNLDEILVGQYVDRDIMQRDFIGLAKETQELKDLNRKLLENNRILKEKFEKVATELDQAKKEREEKENLKKIRKNRKRLPKRDPMTAKIYKELIKAAEGPNYLKVRLRLALCILAVTGIRINELLPLKVSQLETLVKESWISIDRSKKGPSNHKAFLTYEGKKIVKDRKKDFELIFLMKSLDAYIFTSQLNQDKMLRRETLTRDVNKIMRTVSTQLPGKPNITSHSFRIGYITKLWKDSKDLEFVRQTLGHRNIDTTSSYVNVNQLADQEKQERISKLK